jgi:hypothetical protein
MTLSLIVVFESYAAFGIADRPSRLRGKAPWAGKSNPTYACIDPELSFASVGFRDGKLPSWSASAYLKPPSSKIAL